VVLSSFRAKRHLRCLPYGEVGLIIYEVRNTLGELHYDVLPVQPGELGEAGVRQQQEKLF
jgi:DUF1365 family protein